MIELGHQKGLDNATLFYYLSHHPDLNVHFINIHRDKPWDEYVISSHDNISMTDIFNNNQIWWCDEAFSGNKSLTITDVIQHPEYHWNWYKLSNHPNMLPEYKIKYKLPWLLTDMMDFTMIQCACQHPKWTADQVISNFNINNISCISSHPSITLDYILEHPQIPWHWPGVSYNPNITIQHVKNHPELPWCMHRLTCNDSILWDDIINNPELDWDYKYLSIWTKRTAKLIELNKELIELKDALNKHVFYKFEAPLWQPGHYYYNYWYKDCLIELSKKTGCNY